MTRILTLLIVTCFFNIETFAQNDEKFDFQYNIGTNISIPENKSVDRQPNYEFNDLTEFQSKFGYFAEFMTTYNISNQIGVQGGINYNLYKLCVTQKYGNLESESIVSTSYIHIPILISWKPFESWPMKISGGAYLSFLLTANHDGNIIVDTSGFDLVASDEFSVVNPISEDSRNLKPYYSDHDFGLSFQADYEFLLNADISITIFSRFNVGLKDVITNLYGIYDQYSVFQHYNLGLMLGAGVRF